MCCPLDQLNKLIIRAVAFEQDSKSKEKICHIRGEYGPITLADRISRFFQRLELAEKIAEIADESFHLLSPLFQRYTNVMVYQTLRNLHHGAHDIEHILHSFCFLGDITRFATGNFWEYQDEERNQLDYLRSLGRVCHTAAHFFATLELLHDHQLCLLGRFENIVKYASILSTMGYALWTISLLWNRYQGLANDQFASDLSIHLGGFLFEGGHSIEALNYALPYASLMNRAASLAGIIHAWFIVQRLMPDTEVVRAQFVMPTEIDSEEETEEAHCSHHHHHHVHWHEVKMHPEMKRDFL